MAALVYFLSFVIVALIIVSVVLYFTPEKTCDVCKVCEECKTCPTVEPCPECPKCTICEECATVKKVEYTKFDDTDYKSYLIGHVTKMDTNEDCKAVCNTIENCAGFVRQSAGKQCWLKSEIPNTANPIYDSTLSFYYKTEKGTPGKGGATTTPPTTN